MPDNWGFVFAAYGLALVVLVLYWRFLVRRERELTEGRQIAEHGTGLSTPRAGHPTACTRGQSPATSPNSRIAKGRAFGAPPRLSQATPGPSRPRRPSP